MKLFFFLTRYLYNSIAELFKFFITHTPGERVLYTFFKFLLENFNSSFYYPQLIFIFLVLSVNDHQPFERKFICVILPDILLIESNRFVKVTVLLGFPGGFIPLLNFQS